MKFSCNSQRQSMFRSADCFFPNRKISTRLCSKGFWDPRIDSQVRLVASRPKINVPHGGLSTSGFSTGKLNGHMLPRKLESVPLVFRLSCRGKYSLGDINGYDRKNNDTHKADKELEARRSRDSMIDKVINLSMALDDEAEEDVTELMIWAEPSVVNDAENKSLFGDKTHKGNQIEVLVREATELEEANHELEAIRSRNSIISKGIDRLISLEEEAADAWNDANQILHVVQETIAKEPVQKAVIVLSLGKESSKNDIKEMLENMASSQDRFNCMQIENYELIKEANRLIEAAKRAHNNALEAEEEVMDMMIWGEQAMRLEREAIRRLGDAETAFKIAEKSHGEVLLRETTEMDEANQELDEANQELEAIRSRNSMISNGIDQLIALEEEAAHAWNDANQTLHAMQETIAEECVAKEAVQKAVLTLSLGKESSKNEKKKMVVNLASLHERLMRLLMKKCELMKEANRLSEAAKRAHNCALEAEEEVMEMMVWGEQALTLEREAIYRLNDAENAMKIAKKSHGEDLDEDLSHQTGTKLSLKPPGLNYLFHLD